MNNKKVDKMINRLAKGYSTFSVLERASYDKIPSHQTKSAKYSIMELGAYGTVHTKRQIKWQNIIYLIRKHLKEK